MWQKVSGECIQEFNKPFTEQNCESKWKSLRRTYKSVLLHNNKSGNKRRHWQFFAKMHEYLHNKPEIIPQATCSSSSGLVINKEINKGKLYTFYLYPENL